MKKIARSVAASLLLAGILVGGEGLWIYAKARLAQLLLELSWRSELTGRRMRPWPWADTYPLAKLRIERDGSEIVILAGASGRTMAFGPGHVDGTADPGDPGNCVITAHRDTHFAALQFVQPGDRITVERTDGHSVRYLVKATRIVEKHDTSVMTQDSRTRLTLITCYPFNAVRPGTPLRYVVMAEVESGRPRPHSSGVLARRV